MSRSAMLKLRLWRMVPLTFDPATSNPSHIQDTILKQEPVEIGDGPQISFGHRELVCPLSVHHRVITPKLWSRELCFGSCTSPLSDQTPNVKYQVSILNNIGLTCIMLLTRKTNYEQWQKTITPTSLRQEWSVIVYVACWWPSKGWLDSFVVNET